MYLPAIAGYVPSQMLQAISSFLDFCYIVRQPVITSVELIEVEETLGRFHKARTIFERTGVRLDGFSLPRQHSLVHYPRSIQLFGAPNGLCSSITESKHIKAVKEPWRRSNRYEALGQMLLINQRLDKLAAARADFAARGMLEGPVFGLQGLAALLPAQPPSAPPPPTPADDSDDSDGSGDESNLIIMAKRKGVFIE